MEWWYSPVLKLESLRKIVNDFYSLPIFGKLSILDVCKGFGYLFAPILINMLLTKHLFNTILAQKIIFWIESVEKPGKVWVFQVECRSRSREKDRKAKSWKNPVNQQLFDQPHKNWQSKQKKLSWRVTYFLFFGQIVFEWREMLIFLL